MFVYSVIVAVSDRKSSPLMKKRKEVKIDVASKEYQQLITSRWQVIKTKW